MRVSRTVAYTLVAMLALSLLAATAKAKPPRLAGQIAKAQTALWKCQDTLGRDRSRRSVHPGKIKSDRYAQWVLKRWASRWNDCLQDQQEWQRQYDWETWLPDKWRRIGVCETQLNWRHSNSSYQGAFGFAVSSWDAFKLPGYPDEAWQATPWQQYQVALAIYDRYGFSGWGCRGA